MNWDKVIDALIEKANLFYKRGLSTQGDVFFTIAKTLDGAREPQCKLDGWHDAAECTLCRNQRREQQTAFEIERQRLKPFMKEQPVTPEQRLPQDAAPPKQDSENKNFVTVPLSLIKDARCYLELYPPNFEQFHHHKLLLKQLNAILDKIDICPTKPPEPTKITPKPYITYKKIGEATYQTCEMRWDEEKGCYTNNIGIGAIFTHKEQAAEYGRSWAMNIDCEFIEPREPSIYSRQSL